MSIRDFFTDQTILITGGTGFIGKVLIEKLLRSCSNLNSIYLCIRDKKGVSKEKRWEEMTKMPIFDNLNRNDPEALKKVKLISADRKHPNLGISEEDKNDIIKNVTIVYHSAATVQFADNIIDTLIQNTRATHLMLELASEIENLKVFVYVSTAYTNFFRPKSQWDEKIYPPVQDWRVILRMLEKEQLSLAMIKEKLLCGHPNPYTFSKSLAEQMIVDYSDKLKAVIVRPSVVMPANEEPLKGWVDSLNGMAILCIANSFGILRVARHSEEAHQDYVPVDAVSKFLVIAAKIGATRTSEQNPPVFNCTIGDLLTIRTSDISYYTTQSQCIEKTPSKFIVWTRNLKLVKNPVKYQILFFLEQILPACFLDTVIYLYGAKPLFLRIAKKLAYSNQILFKDFQFSEVHFKNYKFMKEMLSLEGLDKELFGMPDMEDVSAVNLGELIADTYIGVLKYFFHEDLSEKSIARNRRRYNRIVMLDRTLRILFYASLTYFIFNCSREYLHLLSGQSESQGQANQILAAEYGL